MASGDSLVRSFKRNRAPLVHATIHRTYLEISSVTALDETTVFMTTLLRRPTLPLLPNKGLVIVGLPGYRSKDRIAGRKRTTSKGESLFCRGGSPLRHLRELIMSSSRGRKPSGRRAVTTLNFPSPHIGRPDAKEFAWRRLSGTDRPPFPATTSAPRRNSTPGSVLRARVAASRRTVRTAIASSPMERAGTSISPTPSKAG